MSDRRVVVTGLGVVNALGLNRSEYFEALCDSEMGVGRIGSFDANGFPSQVAGEAPPLKMSRIVPKTHRKSTKLMSRDIELAVTAAAAAVRDAGLKTKGTDPDEQPNIDPVRSGVNVGAGLICCDLVELAGAAEHALDDGRFSYAKWGSEGMARLTPLWLLKYLPNMLSCHISIIHDLQGPSNTITCAEAGGLLAIGEAYRTIAHGKADLIIAGGAECKVNPMTLMRQCLLGRASTGYNDQPDQACRPFDSAADGTVVGEGAGIVVLEELSKARARGARIYAEIAGFGASNNFSNDFVQPEDCGGGIAIALKKAMTEAALSGSDISFLVPHGLAVASHDASEAAGIRHALGAGAAKVPILTTKSRIGNCGAGAGAIDLVTAVSALSESIIPPNTNCPTPPAEYGLNITNGTGLRFDIQNALTCCYTFGGQCAALAIRKL